MRKILKASPGFTLIEVLVALIIFSLMAAGFSMYGSHSAKQIAYLRDKTIASVVASNVIMRLEMSKQWPAPGKLSEQNTMAGKDWRVSVQVVQTPYADLRRLEVSVAAAASDEPLVTLTGFAGKH